MNVLILFVEVTSYNIARIRNVYEKCEAISCDYVSLSREWIVT